MQYELFTCLRKQRYMPQWCQDNSLLEPFGADLSEYNVSHSSNFDHCVCPEGFVGLTCEDTIEICPNGEHVCWHY
jgi:hypothetical protein